MKAIARAVYWTAGLLIFSGLIHLAILVTSGDTWQGPLSLRKPATFGLSFGLTLINVTLIASFVPLRNRPRYLLLGSFSAACVLEALGAAAELGVDEQDIVVASVYTTQTVTSVMERIRDQIKNGTPVPANFSIGPASVRSSISPTSPASFGLSTSASVLLVSRMRRSIC